MVMAYARNPKNDKLYFFQLHEDSMEWLAYPENEGDYSLRWSTESRTWIPKEGISLKDWSINCLDAIVKHRHRQMKSGRADGKFFINVTAVLT